MIFDGSSFGTATPAGSDEEADYLGIPGLLDAGQMRDLLSRRQDEQLRQAHGVGRSRRRRRPPTVSSANCARNSTRWSSIAHHRTGKPHGWIHNELRRICGGPPIAAATTVQLQARIKAVHSLHRDL